MDASTLKKSNTSLQIIYFFMVMSSTMMIGIIYYFFNNVQGLADEELIEFTQFFVPGIAVVCFLYPFFGKQKKIKKLKIVEGDDKIRGYMKYTMQAIGLAEAGILLSMVAFVLLGDDFYLIWAGLSWLAVVIQFPTEGNLRKIMEEKA